MRASSGGEAEFVQAQAVLQARVALDVADAELDGWHGGGEVQVNQAEVDPGEDIAHTADVRRRNVHTSVRPLEVRSHSG